MASISVFRMKPDICPYGFIFRCVILGIGAVMAIAPLAHAQMDEEEMTPEQVIAHGRREAAAEGIGAMRALIDERSAQEPVRLGKADAGHLRFFGAPPGLTIPLDAEVRGAQAYEKAGAFLSQFGAAFGIYSDRIGFDLMRETTQDNRTYVRLQQTYADIPVFAGEMIVQLDDDANGVASVMSDIMTATEGLDTAEFDLDTVVDAEKAVQIAADAVVESAVAESADNAISPEEAADFRQGLRAEEAPSLVVYDAAVVGEEGDGPRVAWRLNVTDDTGSFVGDAFIIDVVTGEVLLRYQRLLSARDRNVYDSNDTPQDPFDYRDPARLARGEGDPPTGITEVDEAYDFLGDVYDFYANEHGRDGIDDQGHSCDAEIRIPASTAVWSPADELMLLGTGFADDDAIAHEYTHGVTQHTSGLVASGWSYAINESFSDVWGEFVDLTNGAGTDTPAVKWLIGEDLPALVGVLRSMKNPPDYGDPDKLTDHPIDDNCHARAGINNKLCYLLTEGDTFPSPNGYSISPMDSTFATSLSLVADLYYQCQTVRLTSGADYEDLYQALTYAAVDLSFTTTQRENIEKACRAVEIVPTSAFTIRDEWGEPVAAFKATGDLALYGGTLSAEQASITPSSSVSEFIVRSGASTCRALISYTDGDMFITGKLYENVSSMPTPPSGSFVIKDGTGNVKAFINASSFTNSTLEPVSPYTVPAGSLVLAGTRAEYAAHTPICYALDINNGESTTTSRTVTLDNACWFRPTHYMASENLDFSGASWQTYEQTPSFTLSSGDGRKRIRFKLKNTLGESASYGDSIVLDEP